MIVVRCELMASVEIKVELPEDLAREAQERGLLSSRAIEYLIRSEIRRTRIERLFETMERLSEAGTSPLTDAEVEAEIQAVRRKQR
jgi:post-segregation antitoxin (ccd killing protein)